MTRERFVPDGGALDDTESTQQKPDTSKDLLKNSTDLFAIVR
jgi:hypothetical protein